MRWLLPMTVLLLACQDEPTLDGTEPADGTPPCVSLVPAAVRFTEPNQRVDLKLSRCGGPAVDVTDVRLEGEGFSLGAVQPTPWRLTAWGRQIGVRWDGAPNARGALVVHSEAGIHRAPLVGPDVICPEPRVVAVSHDVHPLDLLTLDGSPSTGAASWRWTVVERPEGSTAPLLERFHDAEQPQAGGFVDDPQTPTAQFFVDLAGRYTFALTVADAAGLTAPGAACPGEARVVVDAVPDAALHVQLVWRTLDDPDEADGVGSDLDVHLRRADDAWMSPQDCHYGSPRPDWPPAGPAGDPSLDIDDVDGAGPENINLRRPTVGETYALGVHAFRLADFGAGPSAEATVRLYVGGALSTELVRTFTADHQWWDVAEITGELDLLLVDTLGHIDPP